jgi:hypothetical protein
MDSKKDMEESKELVWGPGWLTEGKEYIVETYHVDTITGRYKGTYKKPELYIPYVILYDVIQYDMVTNAETTFPHRIFYRIDKFYNSDKL